MAVIVEKTYTIKVSKLVKGDADQPDLSEVLDAVTLEAVIQEMVTDPTVVVELLSE